MKAERILRTLAKHDVRYVVIGALGATFHGSPLRTEDIDICPEPDEPNLDRLGAALNELGAREWDPHKGEAIPRVFDSQMLRVDSIWILLTDAGRLDLCFKPAGFRGYKDLVKDAVRLMVEDVPVTVASLRDIIRSKETAGREKDLAQLPTLRRLLELRSDR